MPDALTIGAIATAFSVVTAAAVGWYLKYRKQAFDECTAEDDRMSANYEFLIGELKGEVKHLRDTVERQQAEHREEIARIHTEYRTEIATIRAEHLECVRVQGELRGELDEVKKMILRHDENNRKQVELNRKYIEEKLAEQGGQ